MTAEKTFEEYYEQAKRADIAGWDFSFLDNRCLVEELPWDYKHIVESYLEKAKSLLDIDTGGGEFLSDLHPLPPLTMATENYKPNVGKAKHRLEPIGIRVVECDAGSVLPFRDRSFDMVINRHGSICASEIVRVLDKNGIFISQQVGAQNNIQLNHFFGDNCRDNIQWDLAHVAGAFQKYDVDIMHAEEYYPKTVFKDIGAVVYYLRYISWQIAGFDIDKNIKKLKELHMRIIRNHGFESKEHRFLLTVKKL
jgi:SAM-dependent methyltransferase